MNKYQEALDLLKCNSEQYIANNSIGIKMERRFNESDEANKSLQELVDKATPKNLEIDYLTNGQEDYLCGTCHKEFEIWNDLGAFTNQYCGNCGQAIQIGIIRGGKMVYEEENEHE